MRAVLHAQTLHPATHAIFTWLDSAAAASPARTTRAAMQAAEPMQRVLAALDAAWGADGDKAPSPHGLQHGAPGPSSANQTSKYAARSAMR